MRVLIVEGDVQTAALIRRGLMSEGLTGDVAVRREDALWMAESTPYDAIVVDHAPPVMDGVATCLRLRRDGVRAPVLMLTAPDRFSHAAAGAYGGADDSLTKPFALAELSARLRALGRRGPVRQPTALTVGDLTLDPATRRVRRGHADVSLSATEFTLLEVFMRHPGEVLDRLALLDRAWSHHDKHRSNVVDVYVRYLREKIDRPFGIKSIETVRGSGYRLRADGGCADHPSHRPLPTPAAA